MTKTKQSPEKELHPSDQHPYGALVFDDREVPHYELAADVLRWRFTINLDGTRTPPFLVDAKPYTETSAIAYLKDKEGEVRPSREEQGADIIPGSLEADPVFFDRHVIQTTFRGKVIPESEMEALSGQFNFKKAIEYRGKRRMLVLTIADIEILRDSACPERHRYFRITQALGDPDKVAELQTECSKLKLNCRACDGCPERPF